MSVEGINNHVLMGLTLGEIISFVTSISVLSVAILFMFKLWSRFEKIEVSGLYRQEDMAMMFMCQRACLEGMKELGANGPVTTALAKLNEFQSNRAAGLTAEGKIRKIK